MVGSERTVLPGQEESAPLCRVLWADLYCRTVTLAAVESGWRGAD